MKRTLIVLASVIAASAAVADDAVGQPIEKITVPLESITVKESQLRAPTYEESREAALNGSTVEARLAAIGHIHDEATLIEIIRRDSDPAVRKEAFSRIVSDDAVFAMIFKPGTNGVADVRLDAIARVAELEVVKSLAERCPDPAAKKAAADRLAAAYAEPADRVAEGVHPTVKAYARRNRQH